MKKFVLTADTPLSALFRENFHKELRTVIETWRPYLIGGDSGADALEICHLGFDLSKLPAKSVYIDLGRLLNEHPLIDDNMHTLAEYLYHHSNLSNSLPTLYSQLRKYKKR